MRLTRDGRVSRNAALLASIIAFCVTCTLQTAQAQAPVVYQSQFGPLPFESSAPIALTAQQAADRRAEIEREIKLLFAQRPSILEPLLVVGAGGALVLVGAMGLLSTGALLPLPSHGGSEDRYTPAQERTNRLSAGAVLAGLVVSGGGLIWLNVRTRERRPINAQIHELKRERRGLELVSLDVQPGRNGLQLAVHLRF